MARSIKLFLAAILVGGQVASFSIPPLTSARSNGLARCRFSSKPASFDTATLSSPASARTSTTTALSAIPSWAIYSITHILAGAASTPVVTRATATWYKRLPLPSWTPPNFVFGPVWTLLYGLMGVSVSRIVKSASPSTNLATKLWSFHFALNISWAQIFFGFRNLRLGLIINFLLVATLGYILPLFHGIDPLAAYLLIPYLLWLIYATKLNQTICKLNPVLGGVNKAMILADLFASGDEDGYNEEMLQYDLNQLQAAAAKYACL